MYYLQTSLVVYRFVYMRNDNRRFGYRIKKKERYLNECTNESLNGGYGSVNVWGGIITGRSLTLIRLDCHLTGQMYINKSLIPHVLPFIIN